MPLIKEFQQVISSKYEVNSSNHLVNDTCNTQSFCRCFSPEIHKIFQQFSMNASSGPLKNNPVIVCEKNLKKKTIFSEYLQQFHNAFLQKSPSIYPRIIQCTTEISSRILCGKKPFFDNIRNFLWKYFLIFFSELSKFSKDFLWHNFM